MNQENISCTFTTNKSPAEVFEWIIEVEKRWSGKITWESKKLWDQFEYQYKDLHTSTQHVVEFIPGQKLVWEVDNCTISFLEKKDERNGTHIIFEIQETPEGTTLLFTHDGITPESECYNACNPWWKWLIEQNLKNSIETKDLQPDVFKDVTK